MTKDRRTAQRRGIHWKALMIGATGQPIGECTIVDVSNSGARLLLENAIEPPDSFVLIMARNGDVRRHCEVTWRDDESVGVKFVRPRVTERARTAQSSAIARLTAKKKSEVADASAD